MNTALKHTKNASFHDLREAVSRFRTANDAICVLVSALTYQVTARTLNQQGCDYCGETYHESGPIAWTSHHCKVLIASETIIAECVQRLLKERGIAKDQIERDISNRNLLRHTM